MKLMRTEDAIGQVLCHDITQIIPGVKKGPVFQKGHIIAPAERGQGACLHLGKR